MRVTLGKDSPEWALFRDYWAMVQDIWGTEDTDEYWQEVKYRIDAFEVLYPRPYARALCIALVNELYERSKK